MTEEAFAVARGLVRRADRATLATLLPVPEQSGAGGGWPYASLVLAAVDHDLSPLLLLSDLAEHSRAIAADGRVSLLYDGTAGLEEPLTGARLTLLGRAERSADALHAGRFLARHPGAAGYAGFRDFAFYRVAVERAHLVAGFGRIAWLDAAKLAPPSLPGLAEAEAGMLAHMNDDHADAVQLYARRLLGLEGEGWRLTGLDAEGLDLRRGGAVARLAFERPLAAMSEVRSTLVALAGRARAA